MTAGVSSFLIVPPPLFVKVLLISWVYPYSSNPLIWSIVNPLYGQLWISVPLPLLERPCYSFPYIVSNSP